MLSAFRQQFPGAVLPNPGLNFKDEINALSGLIISYFHSCFNITVVDRVTVKMDIPNQISVNRTGGTLPQSPAGQHSQQHQLPNANVVKVSGRRHIVGQVVGEIQRVPLKPHPMQYM